MSLMLMAMMLSRQATSVPTMHSQTFTSNASFLVPAGLSVLDSISGHGAAGTPATTGDTIAYTDVTTTYTRRDGGPDYVYTSRVNDWVGQNANTGQDYCDAPVPYCDPSADPNCTVGSTVYSQAQTCYHYGAYIGAGTQATTGASASGFGKVFPGGAGGAAPTTTFTNVPVTAGATYSISVPSGGSITINYRV